MTLLALVAVLPWLLVALAAWLGSRLLIDHGRILLRISSLEQYLEDLGSTLEDVLERPLLQGLPAGAPAPPFELPDLDGHRHALEDSRGRPVLLVFFDPECPFCQRLAPDLAALGRGARPDAPAVLVVSTGDPDANRRLAEEHGLAGPILLQAGREVAEQYGALGTPVGVLIDAEGRIASDLAVGPAAILPLARGQEAAAANGHGVTPGPEPPRPARARGLRPGRRAPNFRLPRLDGGRLSLDEYRGRRVLLVFSDPECPSCDRVVPEIETLHRQAADFQVVMVSRGSPEANRAKAAALGLTFPIALQRGWEVSRLYRRFATPVAYLIDEDGVVAAEAASGGEILGLAHRARSAAPPASRERKEVVFMRWRDDRR